MSADDMTPQEELSLDLVKDLHHSSRVIADSVSGVIDVLGLHQRNLAELFAWKEEVDRSMATEEPEKPSGGPAYVYNENGQWVALDGSGENQ